MDANTTILAIWGSAVVGGLFLLSFVLWLHEKGISLFEDVSKLARRPAFELIIVLYVVGGFVQYGATKGTNGTDRGQTELPSRSATSITPVAVDSTGFLVPTNFPSVTNLCFWGIDKDADVVALGIAWPSAFTNDTIDLFGNGVLATNNWSHLAEIDVSSAFSNAVVEIDIADMPTNMSGTAFFRIAAQEDSDGDGLSDAIEEWVIGTNPASGDSDGDGLGDGEEISMGTDPGSSNSDGDGLDDGEELGWWAYGGAMPVFDVSGGETLLDQTESHYGDLMLHPLPFRICCAGYVHDIIMVGIDGVVALKNDVYSSSISLSSLNQDYSTYVASDKHTVIAAYWDNLYAPGNSGAQITIADVIHNEQRYAVVDYSNIRLNSKPNDSSCVARFQIVIPYADQNTVYVHYISMPGDFDGSSATLGAQLPDRERVFPVAFNTPGAVHNGMVIAYHFGTGSDPLLKDSDEDGLDDGVEASVGSSSRYDDSDRDGMNDYWEYMHGLHPFSSEGDDGSDGDLDGDHLVNIKEFEYGADPQMPDTDNDGLTDGIETGYVFVTNAIPWLTFDEYVDVTTAIATNRFKLVEVPMPAPVRIQENAVTNITMYRDGIFLMNKAGYVRNWGAPSVLGPDAVADLNALVIAPWHDSTVFFRDDIPGRHTAVRYGTATFNGDGYLLFEFLNVYADHYTSSTNAISYQLAIPTNGCDRAYSIYGNQTGQNTSGEYAYIGLQTFDALGKHTYCYHTAGKVWDGLCLEFRFGTNTDPARADTDFDGLSDPTEILLETNPRQPDTDGDGMNDGWEWINHNAGFDPLVDNATDGNPDNDADADPDGDGLTNTQECEWGTDPSESDSDGDGVGDGAEVAHSSDPADAGDGGLAYSRVSVPFFFGDHSGSHSEKYRLEVSPVSGSGAMPRTFSWVNAHYGQCETKTAMLKPGWDYEVRLRHASTNGHGSGFPDYDYKLECSASNVLIDDPDGLFGTDETGDCFAASDKVATLHALYPPKLIPDYNRDGEIDSDDEAIRSSGLTFRFWVNDDNDSGDINDSANDRPGSGSNGQDNVVNGRGDLIDFTPVLIDMSGVFQSGTVSALRNRITWRLESSAVNAAWTALSAEDAGSFQISDCGAAFGPSLLQSVHAATVTNLAGGATLPAAFLSHIANSGDKGVIMIEGRAAGTDLFLRGYLDDSQQPLLEGKLNINVSSVEDMYRWMNVRGASGESIQYPSRLDEPVNMPDSETANRNLMFVHGANVSQSDSRGWASEVFKRLWQSGMTAKFTAVSWRSNIGSSANYQENASNAFFTASILAPQVANLPGTKVLMAHSLGNVVCSSMIQDYGLQVSKYIMCNSAVPSEAYCLPNDIELRVPQLVHPEWEDYPTNSWASNWHKLFSDDLNDDRGNLGWPGRFINVVPYAVNFYSTGDQVLELLPDNNVYVWTGLTSGYVQYSWQHQELWKGRTVANLLGGTTWSGWNIEEDLFGVNKISAQEAQMMTDADFKTNTVFYCYPSSMNATNINLLVRGAHLAQGIPALTPSAGTVPFGGNAMLDLMVNVNDNSASGVERINGWPYRADYPNRWLHSDLRDVSYYFNFMFYDKVMEKGSLR